MASIKRFECICFKCYHFVGTRISLRWRKCTLPNLLIKPKGYCIIVLWRILIRMESIWDHSILNLFRLISLTQPEREDEGKQDISCIGLAMTAFACDIIKIIISPDRSVTEVKWFMRPIYFFHKPRAGTFCYIFRCRSYNEMSSKCFFVLL